VRVADKFLGMNEVEDVRVETTGIMHVENATRSVVKVATRNSDEAAYVASLAVEPVFG
jgi:hypothetical protein